MSQLNLINPIYRKELDYSILQQIEKLDEESFRKFIHYYELKRKSVSKGYLAWFFGLHYGYLSDWATQALFIFTMVILVGIVWLIVDAFRISTLVSNYNTTLAIEILSQHKLSYKH